MQKYIWLIIIGTILPFPCFGWRDKTRNERDRDNTLVMLAEAYHKEVQQALEKNCAWRQTQLEPTVQIQALTEQLLLQDRKELIELAIAKCKYSRQILDGDNKQEYFACRAAHALVHASLQNPQLLEQDTIKRAIVKE